MSLLGLFNNKSTGEAPRRSTLSSNVPGDMKIDKDMKYTPPRTKEIDLGEV